MVHSGIDLLLEVECFHKEQLQSPSGADEQLYSYSSRFEANSHAILCLLPKNTTGASFETAFGTHAS
jgi:hypothetical protein